MAKSKNRTGKAHPIWPAKNGNKSGKGRDNNPPKSKSN